MITGIYHTSFTVSDLDRSIAFYTGIIGMRLVRRHESSSAYHRMIRRPEVKVRVAFLEMGGHFVELIQHTAGGAGTADFYHNHVRAAHLSFFADDVQRTYEELMARGVRFATPPQTGATGRKAVYFYDPDGNALELCEPLDR
jgi:catechol 2,3-dioxygenase-like lactoylglutathione lyase family enzyme